MDEGQNKSRPLPVAALFPNRLQQGGSWQNRSFQPFPSRKQVVAAVVVLRLPEDVLLLPKQTNDKNT